VKGKAADKAAREWLDSPEGQKWSENAHNQPKRGDSRTGVFGEVKSDTVSCDWRGKCGFADRDGKGGCR